MSPFFCTRKSIPQPVRCKSKPLDGTPQCAFHRFCLAATRLPHTPKKTSSYRGCGSPKPDTDTLQGKAVCHPIRYGCFLHGAIPFDRATDILSILLPSLTGSPVSLIPALPVLPAMSPGSAWEEAQPGLMFFEAGWDGLEMTEGKAAPHSFAQAC